MCHSSVLQLKQTISCLLYSKPWNLLLSLLYNSLLYIPDSITSFLLSLVQVTWSHSQFLCKPPFPAAGWSNCSVLDSPLWSYIFSKCLEVGTFPRETCLVVNKSKYFPYFSGSSFLPATPDHICSLLNDFISWMEVQLPDLQPTDPLLQLFCTRSFPNQISECHFFYPTIILFNSPSYFSYHTWLSLAFYHWWVWSARPVESKARKKKQKTPTKQEL